MRSKVTKEQADVFHEFLDAKSIPRKCHMCGHPYSTAHHRAIVGLTEIKGSARQLPDFTSVANEDLERTQNLNRKSVTPRIASPRRRGGISRDY
jgi:hypothetical protein